MHLLSFWVWPAIEPSLCHTQMSPSSTLISMRVPTKFANVLMNKRIHRWFLAVLDMKSTQLYAWNGNLMAVCPLALRPPKLHPNKSQSRSHARTIIPNNPYLLRPCTQYTTLYIPAHTREFSLCTNRTARSSYLSPHYLLVHLHLLMLTFRKIHGSQLMRLWYEVSAVGGCFIDLVVHVFLYLWDVAVVTERIAPVE
jgi:hypothetical protein